MSLHQAEWLAAELITLAAVATALAWAWQRHRETPPDDRGQQEATEYSSTTDD